MTPAPRFFPITTAGAEWVSGDGRWTMFRDGAGWHIAAVEDLLPVELYAALDDTLVVEAAPSRAEAEARLGAWLREHARG